MVDLHCHLLPGIDDGPPTMDDAMALAEAAVAGGTTTIVATPHVSWDWPANDAARIGEVVAAVRAELRRRGIPLHVGAGAEVAMTRAAGLPDDELRALHLADGPWLLLECPLTPSATGFEALARALQARGHRILLAHPERSPHFRREGALARLTGEGMLAQLTATSFTGRFGRDVQRVAHRMLEQGLVANVASDAHSAAGSRPPAIGPELRRAGLDPGLVRHLTELAPAAIAAGDPVPAAPRAPRRGLLGRLRRA